MFALTPQAVFQADGSNFEARIVADYSHSISKFCAEREKLTIRFSDPNRVWRVSSAVQKSIRRGEVELADRYAQALINSDQSKYYWTRLPVIAMEDIGLGNPELCALILALSRFKKYRDQWDEGLLASYLAIELAKSVKNRTFCDLTCSIHFGLNDLGHVAASTSNLEATLKTLVSPYADHKNVGWYDQLVSRSYMSSRLLGNREHERNHNIEYTSPLQLRLKFLEFLSDQPEMSALMFYLIYCGSKKGVHGLNEVVWPLIKTLPDNWADFKPIIEVVPELRLICGVPDYSFDQHVSEGKKAIAYICKSSPELKEFFANNPVKTPSSTLGMVLFQTESALLDRRTGCPLLEKITANNDVIEFRKVGLEIQQGVELRKLLRSESVSEQLFEVRKKVTS